MKLWEVPQKIYRNFTTTTEPLDYSRSYQSFGKKDPKLLHKLRMYQEFGRKYPEPLDELRNHQGFCKKYTEPSDK
jgi:hypothetical protein